MRVFFRLEILNEIGDFSLRDERTREPVVVGSGNDQARVRFSVGVSGVTAAESFKRVKSETAKSFVGQGVEELRKVVPCEVNKRFSFFVGFVDFPESGRSTIEARRVIGSETEIGRGALKDLVELRFAIEVIAEVGEYCGEVSGVTALEAVSVEMAVAELVKVNAGAVVAGAVAAVGANVAVSLFVGE